MMNESRSLPMELFKGSEEGRHKATCHHRCHHRCAPAYRRLQALRVMKGSLAMGRGGVWMRGPAEGQWLK
eukprot:1155443-Pelagomonas_calceolata.AAC.3